VFTPIVLYSRSSVKEPEKKRASVAKPAPSSGATGGPLDFLASIMEDQDNLRLSSKHVTINRDGE